MIEIDLIKPVNVLLQERSQQLGSKTAYRDAHTSVTYEALEQRTGRLATALQKLGIEPGESVAIHVPYSVSWIEDCLAIIRRGAVVVPISYDASEAETRYRLQDAGCKAVISTAERAQRMENLRASVASLETVVLDGMEGDTATPAVKPYESLLNSPVSEAAYQGSDLDAPSFILYTSGTTGKAKGVVLSQRNMLWVIAACWKPIAGIGPEDYMLSPLPLFHSYPINLVVLGTLAMGMTTRVMERFSTKEVLALLRGGDFTIFAGVPTMFHYLLERGGDTSLDLGRLRLCLSAGDIMTATLNEEFEKRTGVPLIDGYGITETATMVTSNWPHRPRIMGSCGLALPGLAVRIVDQDSRVDVPPGAEGELIVRGPNVMLRYHNKPEETAKALVDGWYLTGDLARFDAHGFITITGRLKELIIRGGENIAPAEIEEVALQFPGVTDCVAVAGKHKFLGEVPVLFVVPGEGAEIDTEALKDFCREHLSARKVPAQIRFIDSVPRTGSGKARRFELAKLMEE